MRIVRTPCVTVAVVALAIHGASAAEPEEPPRLTIERIYSDPALDGGAPHELAISPDGSLVTYLKPKENDFEVLDLWAYDVEAGKERRLLVDARVLDPEEKELSEEEKARRERMRIKSRARGPAGVRLGGGRDAV